MTKEEFLNKWGFAATNDERHDQDRTEELWEDFNIMRRQPCGNLQPLYDKIVVETIEGDTVVNGLTIPEGSREKPMKGVIVAVGPGKDSVALKVKIGDVVLHQKHAGVEVNLGGKDYLLMRETDIFAII